jgi:hypothetical protein
MINPTQMSTPYAEQYYCEMFQPTGLIMVLTEISEYCNRS